MNIISRESAGLRAPTSTPRAMASVSGLIVHCTAGSQPTGPEHALEVWRNVQRYHQDNRHWSDIGYSFGFDDYGQVIEGRGWKVHGAHSGAGWNGHYHGIAYLGTGKQPTELALMALNDFIACHDQAHGVGELFGHRDIAAKGCPGDGVYAWMLANYPHRNPHLAPPPCET